jgi:ribosomal protein S18 acetylase RimI-like enzyme
MPVKIRPLHTGDRAALVAILRETPEFKPFEVKVAEEVIDSYLANPGGSGYYALAAVEGGEVVGFLCYGPTPCTEGTWDMYWEAVAAGKRGRGIGTALMEAGEAHISREGGRLVLVETSSLPLYENTRRFHARRGYAVVARIADFYAPGDDRLILCRRLK